MEYSIAVVGEDFTDDYIVFDMMIFGGYVDFNDFMSSEYSLRSAGNTETLIATYAYDANGNRIGLTYANGTTTTYAYNQANLVTSVVNKKGTTILSTHTYTYYLDGNIASENENGTTKTYEYDGLGRLTRETKNGTITLYTYDANGNRATMTQNGVATVYEYDANNRLLKETVAGAVTGYDYDANGNLINAWNAGNPVGAYAYNLFGNQVSFTADSIVYTNYTYRADGLRHSIDDKVHVWDGANIVADVDGSDVVVYIRGINLIYADDGDKTYYHFNAHGDVVVLTNASGNKTKSYSYNAFGVEYNEVTLDSNPFRYCGEYYDKETQTIYLRARYYDSTTGRFTQEDPIRDGYNWYSYCGGNPVMFVDSSGNVGILFWLVVGCSIGVTLACVITPTSSEIDADAEKHYARNDLNEIDKDIDEIKNTYVKQSENMDEYHENTDGKQGEDAIYNDKYLSPDGGHSEVIICSPPDKEPYIVDENVDEINMGTYNYASNEIPGIYHISHFFQDMIPYYLFGNTRSDKTGILKPVLNNFK